MAICQECKRNSNNINSVYVVLALQTVHIAFFQNQQLPETKKSSFCLSFISSLYNFFCEIKTKMPRDQNGNEISDEDRINRNMARFLSTEKQQKQLLLCLRQQEMPKRLRMGKLTSMKVACKNFLVDCKLQKGSQQVYGVEQYQKKALTDIIQQC